MCHYEYLMEADCIAQEPACMEMWPIFICRPASSINSLCELGNSNNNNSWQLQHIHASSINIKTHLIYGNFNEKQLMCSHLYVRKKSFQNTQFPKKWMRLFFAIDSKSCSQDNQSIILLCPRAGISLQTQHSPLYSFLSLLFVSS